MHIKFKGFSMDSENEMVHPYSLVFSLEMRGHHGCDRMIVGSTTTYEISSYYH